MLQNGAVKVYAVDVGYGQLAWSLRTDARVVNMERTNIRNVTPDMLAEPIEFFSVDVSFISLKHIFPVADAVCTPGACGVCLVKPQFEAGREKVGKRGVVREPATHREVLRAAIGYAEASHFSALGLDFFAHQRAGRQHRVSACLSATAILAPGCRRIAVDRVVEAAHAALDKAPSGH